MKVTVTNEMDDMVHSLEVSPDLDLENFKALVKVEFGMQSNEYSIYHNGRILVDLKQTLKSCGVVDGDVLLVSSMPGTTAPGGMAGGIPGVMPRGMPGGIPNIDFSSVRVPGSTGGPRRLAPGPGPSTARPNPIEEDPAKLMEMLNSNAAERAILKERNPPLAAALEEGNLQKFTEVLGKQRKEKAERERQRILMLTADPFDPSAQSKIAEEIRLQNVESNMETAMEHAPESFGQVVMLYIDCRVNGHPVKAFVDSGAQMTIMSQACAERCNIMRLVDKRWAGIAKGVGTQKIIGRVHLGQIQIGNDFLQSSFSILEDQPMDMLLGLDMLRRHQCSLDLKRNCLVIGTTGTETPFLSEAELPIIGRLNNSESMEDAVREAEDKSLAEALAKSAQDAGASGPSSAGPSSAGTSSQTKSPSTSSTSSGSSSSSSRMFPEADVKKLVDMGYTREQVLAELRNCSGDVNRAMFALIAKSIKVPKP